MPDTGNQFAGTGTADSSVGQRSWNRPDRIAITGTARSDHNPEQTTDTHWLVAANFGFSIASDKAIDGLKMIVSGRASSSDLKPTVHAVELVKAGIIQSDGSSLLAGPTIWADGMNNEDYTYGSESQLPQSLTPADVNDAGFGVALQMQGENQSTSSWASIYVDYVQLQVFYSDAQTSGDGNSRRRIARGIARAVARGHA